MDVRALVGASLATVSVGGCCWPLWCGKHHDFEIEGHTLTGEQLDRVFRRADGVESELCEAACDEAVQEVHGGSLVEMHTCELHIDPLFVFSTTRDTALKTTGTTGDTTLATGDTSSPRVDTGGNRPGGVIDCVGAWSQVCEGRRPLRHHAPGPCDGSVREVLRSFVSLEQASVTAFRELGHQLPRLGAPQELRRRCAVAMEDERRHVRLLRGLGGDVGDADIPETMDVEASALDIAVHNASEGCVSECWSVVLARYTAERSPSAAWRRAFRRVARDEARHGQLAWDIHTWLQASVLTAEERVHVALRREHALSALEQVAADQVRDLPPILGFPAPAEVARAAARFAGHVRSHAATA